jgi:dTDP-L-rhamnose 4-epimerase
MMLTNFDLTYSLPTVILRFFNVFGPRQSLNNPYTGIITAFLNCLLSGQAPEVYENGLMTRDFVYVGDVVNACALAMVTERANHKVINIGTGEPTSILELANTMCGLFSGKIQPNIVEKARVGDIAHCIADTSVARELLGDEPSTPLLTGLREVIKSVLADKFTNGSLSSQAEGELRAAGLLIS